jgi:hypothetical protein
LGNAGKILVGNVKGRDYLVNLEGNGKIILELILDK